MKTLLLCAALCGTSFASAAIAPFRDGERVVFLGDSITAFNHYIADVQFFMDMRRGEKAPYFMNCGTAGDSAGPAVDRIACDLMPMRPERVIVMLGMNDVDYDRWTNGKSTPQLDGVIAAYGKNLRVLVDRLLARGLKVDLMTPSPFDEYSTDLKRKTHPGCNEVGLTRLAAHVRALAAEKKLGLVEAHAPMTAIEKAHPTGLHYSGPDRVHPSPAGNRFLAAAVLAAADEVPGSVLTVEGVEELFAMPKGSDAERLWTALAPVRKEMERLRGLVYFDRFVKGLIGKEVDLADIGPAADATDRWVASEIARGTDEARVRRLERAKADYRANRTKAPAYQDALEKLHRETVAKWQATVDALKTGFLRPPHGAKPHTWYHMMNGNVTKEGLTRDFEALAEIGIGGVQMFDAGCEIPAGPLKFNSPEWFELLRHAASEARRLGLELCLPNCSGWSSSGGPWVKPEDGMMTVDWSAGETLVGPTNFQGRLEQPPFASEKARFYRDLAVIAVPVPPAETRTFEGTSETLEGMQARFTAAAPVTSSGLCLRYRYGPTYGIYGKLLVEASDDGETFREIGRFVSNPCEMCIRDESVRTIRFAKRETYRILRVKYLFENGSIVQANLKLTDLRPTDRAELTQASAKRLQQRASVTRDAFATRPDEIVPSAACTNLTALMQPDGTLAWRVPAGTWRLYRIGYKANGRQNHPASAFGVGLEVDKFSAAALQRHFDSYIGRLCETLGPGLCGERRFGLNNILVDSYEVGSQTWTPGFEKIFRARMGYDLAPYYPVLLGYIVDSTDVTERFLEDYRRVLCDLFAENYGKAMAKACHARGLKLSLEPYGNGPCDNLQYGEAVDIPMAEFWSHSRNPWPNDCGNVKPVSGLAHFWGRRYVGAEAFTASGSRASRGDNGPDTGGWTTTPFDLKAQGDAAYCAGLNRVIYHRFVHQPWAKTPRLPGMTMGKWGMHFDRTQTWWTEGRAWITYQSRCQWMMQEGAFVADFLVFCGEDAPNRSGCADDSSSASPGDVVPAGYDYDLAAREALKVLRVEKGELVSPAGMRYRVLVLPAAETMSLDLLRTVERLVRAGACVVGPVRPTRVPGLAGGRARADEASRLAAAVWVQGVLPDVSAALAKLNLTPDCTLAWSGGAHGLAPHWIHRRNAAADWYFVAANNRAETTFTASLRGTYPVVELWDAEHGEIRRARRVRQAQGRTEVTFELPIAGSVFLVGRKASAVPVEADLAVTAATPVEGPWEVTFPKDFKPNALAKEGGERLVFESLVDWAKHPAYGVSHFSGTAEYRKTLEIDAATYAALAAGSRVMLDLGDVRHFATVTVNGKTFPALWKPPYRVDISEALLPNATNRVVIRLTNLWANKLIDDAGKPEDCAWDDKTVHGRAIREIPAWVWSDRPSPTGRDTFVTWEHWKKTDRLQPSGLIGPVRLVRRDPVVLDLDFGATPTNVIARSGKGRFEGVLPTGVSENFTGWAEASVRTRALSENGRRFVRFETEAGSALGQFAIRVAASLTTGYYRVEIESRNARRSRSHPVRLLARLGPPKWKGLWSDDFGGRDWADESRVFFIDAKDGCPDLYLLTQPGTAADIRSIRVTRATPQDLRALHVPNRPSPEQGHFARHMRFPLGLPSGWNTDLEGVFVTTSAGRSDDGLPTFRFESVRTNSCFYSEPLLTSATGGVATVRLRYRAAGTWRADALADHVWHWAGGQSLPASETWREASFAVKEPPTAEAWTVRISGQGTFELDRFDVTKGTVPPPPDADHAAEVTLQVTEGEVAGARLQFVDEPARLSWAVTDAPKGATLRLAVSDLYGRRRALAPVALKGARLETGTLAYLPADAETVGQFRVDAEVVRGETRVSPREELVVTRIRKPVYWKRQAPNSPFGTHLIARQDTLLAAKAAGINWTRFHDAGTEYSGWYDLEREKGKWTFHDEEIERFRRAGIMMYAQLGTAPSWATHFAESRFATRPNHYFAKYLRPTNTVDYLAYVTKFVTRYRGVIDDYFIWNEPWGGWWVTADDARFFSTNQTELVRQYGRFSNATYAAAKAANPNARISGFNAVGGKVDWWMEPLVEVGVMDACDDIDFHYYTPAARLCNVKDEPLSAGPLAPLRRRWPDLKGKRVIMSEGQGVSTGGGGVSGRMTGLYRTIFAFAPESPESYASMSDQTCRYNLDLLSEGVCRIFVYTTHSYSTMAVKPKFQSLFGADGYPHPELVAHAHMARLVEDRAFVDRTAYGVQGVRLRFRGKDGSLVEAYAELSREEAAKLVREAPDACTDLWGNPLDVTVWPEGTLVYCRRDGDVASAEPTFVTSPTGNDRTGDGTRAKPFRTLARAVEAARRVKGARTVELMPGDYCLAETLNLVDKDANLTIRAAKEGSVRLRGDRRLTGWQPDGEGLFAADVPDVREGRADSRTLFVNGVFAPRAELPGDGKRFKMRNEPKDLQMRSAMEGFWNRKPTDLETRSLEYDPKDLGPGFDAKNAEVRVFHVWSESLCAIASNVVAESRLWFTKAIPPLGIWKRKDYIVYNTREGLTHPGQWYLDRTRGKVVYRPKPGEDIAKLDITLPLVTTLLRGDRVPGLTLAGLTFTGTTPPLMRAGFAGLDLPGAVEFSGGCNRLRLDRVDFDRLGGSALKAQDCADCRISRCRFTDIGCVAVKAGGNNFEFVSNAIHRVGTCYPSACGANVGGNGGRVWRNTLTDGPYSGFIFRANTVYEENRVMRVMRELSDGAAFYGSGHGIVIRNNVVSDVHTIKNGYGGCGFYCDEGGWDNVFENNVTSDVGIPIHMHMTRGQVVRNNTFLSEGDMTISFQNSRACTFAGNRVYAAGHVRVTSPDALSTWKDNVFFGSCGSRLEPEPERPIQPVKVVRTTSAKPGARIALNRDADGRNYGSSPMNGDVCWDAEGLHVRLQIVHMGCDSVKEGAVWGEGDGVRFTVNGRVFDRMARKPQRGYRPGYAVSADLTWKEIGLDPAEGVEVPFNAEARITAIGESRWFESPMRRAVLKLVR